MPICNIIFDPLNYVYVSDSQTIKGFAAFEGINNREYVYVDIPKLKEKSFNTTETSYSYLAPRRGTVIIKNTKDNSK